MGLVLWGFATPTAVVEAFVRVYCCVTLRSLCPLRVTAVHVPGSMRTRSFGSNILHQVTVNIETFKTWKRENYIHTYLNFEISQRWSVSAGGTQPVWVRWWGEDPKTIAEVGDASADTRGHQNTEIHNWRPSADP